MVDLVVLTHAVARRESSRFCSFATSGRSELRCVLVQQGQEGNKLFGQDPFIVQFFSE